jgi:hypothetical protein
MALNIGFIDDPETQLIGDIIKSWVGRLVACSNRIDVVPLHGQQIILHKLVRNCTTIYRMMFMPIDTAEDNTLPINQKETLCKSGIRTTIRA